MSFSEEISSLMIDDTVYITQLTRNYNKRKPYVPHNPKLIKAFIPGTIREVFVRNGDTVKIGDKLLILEAMKMMNTVTASQDGKIKNVAVSVGKSVAKNDLMIEFE